MLTVLGWSIIGGSVLWGASPLIEMLFMRNRLSDKKLKEELRKTFVRGDFFKKVNNKEVYPTLLNFERNRERITFVFAIQKGFDPETFKKREYVFKQHFGSYIDLDIRVDKGILTVYQKGLTKNFKYAFEIISESIKGMKLPIVGGVGIDGELISFDMAKNPHVLIAGETGSGKSSEIRSVLTTLIKTKSPDQLQLILGDLKRSEFHLFKKIKHVTGVFHSADELRPQLKKVKREMVKRGNKLDAAGVNSIDDLNEQLPYIVVCIDEVVLLKKETDITDILEEISSIGRSLGVFVILSMQRPDSKLLDGKLKVNLTVRMGFKTADSINSKIIGTPGSEKLENPGRMLLAVNSKIQEVQCPWLENNEARKLLSPYKQEEEKSVENESNEYEEVLGVLEDEK